MGVQIMDVSLLKTQITQRFADLTSEQIAYVHSMVVQMAAEKAQKPHRENVNFYIYKGHVFEIEAIAPDRFDDTLYFTDHYLDDDKTWTGTAKCYPTEQAAIAGVEEHIDSMIHRNSMTTKLKTLIDSVSPKDFAIALLEATQSYPRWDHVQSDIENIILKLHS